MDSIRLDKGMRKMVESGVLCPKCESRLWQVWKYNARTEIFTKKCVSCNHTEEFLCTGEV